MGDLAQRHRFQDAVVMGRGGQVEYAAGFGLADIERQLPFTPDTPTDGPSMAKTFTAATLLMLVNEGRIDLKMPVPDILPEHPRGRTRVRHPARARPPLGSRLARKGASALRSGIRSPAITLARRERP